MKTLLIIEDDDTIRNLLGRLLEKEYIVLLAANISEAIQKIAMKKVNYICSDYHLSDGIGLEILSYLKNEGKKIPTIIMSSNISHTLEMEAKLDGAIGVIEKADNEFLEYIKKEFSTK